MVEKDPLKRPTASDALRFPFVLRQIEVCLHALSALCFESLVSVMSNNFKSDITLMEGHEVREQTVNGSI